MDNACAGVVAQDQGPAGRWDLSREKVRGVSCDAAAQVTAQDAANGPVWEIGTISFVPYAMVPIFFFFFLNKHSVHFLATPLSQKTNQTFHPRKAAKLHLIISLCLGKSNGFQNELVSPGNSDQYMSY